MQPRIISPPRAEWGDLPAPLTAGERKAADFFDRMLSPEWEIYIQPHLNGLRPDFVLLHPEIGVAVYEVKDWNPGAADYWVDHRAYVPTLTASYPGAKSPVALSATDNPFLRIRTYKSHIHKMSTGAIEGPRGNEWVGYGRITAGVIFTVGATRYWQQLAHHFRQPKEPERYYPVVGRDAIEANRIDLALPEAVNPRWGLMTEQIAESLRIWMREPDFVRQQRQPIPLNAQQQRLINTAPGVTGLRRLRGPAGSGKSMVSACRAAKLAADGKYVLTVGFNITLSHYLRDLAVRHLRQLTRNRKEYRTAVRRMTFTHYHDWIIKRDDFRDDLCNPFDQFDAIMIDEGQDFELNWWDELRQAVKAGGEMMLAFDKTQDIYRRAGAWSEQTMQGSGFRGPWNELDQGYRCHEDLISALRYFAENFMQGSYVDLPQPVQRSFGPLYLRWVQINQRADWIERLVSETQTMIATLPRDSAISDVVCLVPEHEDGYRFVNNLELATNMKVSHIFSGHPEADVRQRMSVPLKLQFWAGNGSLKATTIHSFKGWECRHLLVYIDDIRKSEVMPALFYTALTRLITHIGGSSLTVVSACDELRDFGRQFFHYLEVDETADDNFDDLPF